MKAILKLKNIKGHTKTVTLGRTNIITGHNGAGKSAILEALVVALDGEHPTAGKSLAGICTMISGDRGEIELTLEHENSLSIIVKRVFINGENKTQKIYIDGEEVLQTVAREKIDAFMGGAAIRKISPFRFSAMSPKERLSVIADLLPAGSIDVEDTLRRDLYSGSEEYVGQTRYALGKTIDSLTKEEMDAIYKKAVLVDKDYLDIASQYLLRPGDDIDALDKMIAKNRADVNECQSEVTRYTKSIQTHQDALGAEIWEKDNSSSMLESIEKAIIEKSKILAEGAYAAKQKERMQQELNAMNIGELKDSLKKAKKEAKAHEKYASVDGDEKAYKTTLDQIKGELELHDKHAPMVAQIAKNIDLLNEEMITATKETEHYQVDLDILNQKIAAHETDIASMTEYIKVLKGNSCPVCSSPVDGKALSALLKKQTEEKKISLRELKAQHTATGKKWQDTNTTKNKLSREIREAADKLAVSKASVLPVSVISSHKEKIGHLEYLIHELELKSDYMCWAKHIEQTEDVLERAKKLENDIDSVSVSVVNAAGVQDDIDALTAEKDTLLEMQKLHAEHEAIKTMLQNEQLVLDRYQQKRAILKKVGQIMADTKKKTYWFIQSVMDKIHEVMGYDGIVSSQMFGLSKDGVEISDKVLSGGERLMYLSSILIAAAGMSSGNTIIEIEGGELDSDNVVKLSKVLRDSKAGLSIITTHTNISAPIEGVDIMQL